MFLDAGAPPSALTPACAYGRNLPGVISSNSCQTATDETAAPLLPVEAAAPVTLGLQAPPMRGGEFLTVRVLAALWQEFGERIGWETGASGGVQPCR